MWHISLESTRTLIVKHHNIPQLGTRIDAMILQSRSQLDFRLELPCSLYSFLRFYFEAHTQNMLSSTSYKVNERLYHKAVSDIF